MQDLPLHALRAFAAVYAHGGIRAAARELGIAHSSISRHVAELNAWLGVPVARVGGGKRGLALTPQGEVLGKATLASLQEIARVAGALREARSGRSVTIAAAPSFAARWLLPRLPELEKALPRIEVSVVVDQRLTDLRAEEVDFAIRIGDGRDTIDLQPCGGTHVRSTAEIGRLRIGKIEKKGRENRRVSLHFAD